MKTLKMTRCIMMLAAFWAAPAFGQTTPATPPSGVQISGSFMPGVQQVRNDTNSSKLSEYRDFRDSFYLSGLTFGASDGRTGRYFDLAAVNVGRLDQTLRAVGGRAGAWKVLVDWTDTPHLFSNKAVTPYIDRGGGLLEVPATVPITFK